MVCPNCGTDIPEGCLYCPKCGDSIQIVPDFEPDIEENLAETRNNIAGAIGNMDNADIGTAGDKTADLNGITREINVSASRPQEKNRRSRTTVWVVFAIFLCVAAALTVTAYSFYSNTYQAHMKHAASYMADMEYVKAAEEYIAAADKVNDDADSRLGAAQALDKSGETDEALSYIQEVLAVDPNNEEAYSLAISIYKGRGDYTAINKLIASCPDDAIFQKYSEYLALPPEFSEDAGQYDELITLVLSSDEDDGKIYYTTDGSTPGTSSRIYSNGIQLKEGKNIISAVCVNSKGFISATVTNEYDIELKIPDAPQVMPGSGSFTEPENIVVTVSGDDTVFYTTDGTTPTDASYPYSGEIPMPLGESTLSFVTKASNGKISDVTVVNYDLDYTGVCRPEEAVNYLVATLIMDGSLLDAQGHVTGSSGTYTYMSNSCAKAGSRIYYIIDEYYTEPGGGAELTGTQYALDTVGLGLYKTSRDADGGFVFEMFY